MKTKKEKILNLFNSKDWSLVAGSYVKTFCKDDFRQFDLESSIEYLQKYGDVIYARRIIQSLGFKVRIGSAFHVYQ